VCHYAQLTVPVPAVILVTLNPPLAAAVEPVKPAPIVIVLVSGYFKTTIPEPPLPPACELPPEPPPPLPVFAVALSPAPVLNSLP
jgi:hypothetical protein